MRQSLRELTGAGAAGRVVDVEVDHAVLTAAGERAGQVVAEGLLVTVVIVAVLALVEVCGSKRRVKSRKSICSRTEFFEVRYRP